MKHITKQCNICKLLIVSLLMCTFTSPAYAEPIIDGNISADDTVVYYDKEQQEILSKIDYLGQLKAKAVSLKEYLELDPEKIDLSKNNVYGAILSEIDNVRAELISLGAKPSTETLENFKFSEPISVQGILIDDFASFENTFEGAFDLWGISQTVEASYGTYETYDIVIQDYPGNAILSTHIRQNGVAGYDIYAENSSVSDVVYGEVGSIMFEKIAELVVDEVPGLRTIYNGAQILGSLQSISDGITANDAITGDGLGQSYRINCTATSTVHFIYVRPIGVSSWQHTYSANTIYLDEWHNWAMTISIGNGRTKTNTGSKDYSTNLYPNRWSYRLTDAITAYRNNRSLYHNVYDEYTVNVVKVDNGSITREAFIIDIKCPITYNDLVRYGVQ